MKGSGGRVGGELLHHALFFLQAETPSQKLIPAAKLGRDSDSFASSCLIPLQIGLLAQHSLSLPIHNGQESPSTESQAS